MADRHSTAVKNTCKDVQCQYVKSLLGWARAFCKHILNHRLDEELFERVQIESGRSRVVSLKKYFEIRWDAEAVMLQKLVVLKHNINTLISHAKYSGPKDLTPDRMEHLQVVFNMLSPSRAFSLDLQTKQIEQNSRIIFLITELVTTVERFQVPDEIIFEFVDHLENFRLKLLENYHKYLDLYLTFIPMVIGSYLNPNFRLAFLSDEAVSVAREELLMALGTYLLKTGVFAYPKQTTFSQPQSEASSTTEDVPLPKTTIQLSRIQKLINAKQQPPAERLPSSQATPALTYDERVQKVDAEIRKRVNEMLGAWENEEIIFNDDGVEINNKEFWYAYKKNDGLKWVAKFYMGRPPTQCEDERHFTRTGMTVSPRRARLYPENVEKSLILSKIIEFFGFILYPEMEFTDCIPNKLFRNRASGLPFAVFSQVLFQKWTTFKLSSGVYRYLSAL